MEVEVEVISKEIIKPSSPTPNHLRHHQFSYLDQISPSIYSSLVLFFEFNGETQPNITEISNHLKKSLAEVLTLFYPLAGRSHYNLYIDCNDQGIPFLEARVNNCKLSDVLHNPIPDEVNKLVPFDLDAGDNNIPLGVQLNVFECGGFAIGQCVSHKIADGLSMLMFSQAWAATTRRALGDHQVEIQHPEFVAATLFPTKLFAKQLEARRISVTKNKVTKRFVFDASNIEDLRAKYVGIHENQMIKRPSRFETLSAFISSRFAAVTEYEKLHSSIHAVNLRPRFDPPLPLHSFGNLVSGAGIPPSLLNTRGACYDMARQVREAISKINKGYIKKLQGGAGHMSRSSTGEEVVASFYTSLCKFPLYDNDFGWGRPSWVSVGVPGFDLFDNVVIFVDTRDADGIEACITSPKEVLTKLESDTEFLGRVRPICVGSGLSLTHHRPHLQMSGHRGNRPSMIKKPTAPTKPVTWGAGSVKLFGLAVFVQGFSRKYNLDFSTLAM